MLYFCPDVAAVAPVLAPMITIPDVRFGRQKDIQFIDSPNIAAF